MKYVMPILLMFMLVACKTTPKPQTPNASSHRSQPYDAVLHDYLVITGTKKNIVKTRQMVFGQMKQNIGRAMTDLINNGDFDDHTQRMYAMSLVNTAISKFAERMEKESDELMPFPELERKVIGPIFKKYFTTADLETLTAFYGTPVGQKYVSLIDTLMQEIATETNKRYGNRLYQLSNRIAAEEFEKIKWELKALENR